MSEQTHEIMMHAPGRQIFEDFKTHASAVDRFTAEAMFAGSFEAWLHNCMATAVYCRSAYLNLDGKPVPLVMFGVNPVQGEQWNPWIVTTGYADGSYKFAKSLLAFMGDYMNVMCDIVTLKHWTKHRGGVLTAPVLETYVHADNRGTLGLCRRLGFTIDEPAAAGTEGHLFCRVWRML